MKRKRIVRRFQMRLKRVECKDGKHFPGTAFWREKGSRFVTEVTICKACHEVIEIVGRRASA